MIAFGLPTDRKAPDISVSSNAPHILLVNPWIHDFAAYDFWAKPHGLLSLAAILRQHGCRVTYIDCQDRFHPRIAKKPTAHRWGRGPFLKWPIPKPAALADIPRRYCRYGISPQWFHEDLNKLASPDVILVTSMMTYWYPGVQETIRHIRSVFPQSPIILGGIYATLCGPHAAAHSGADRIFSGPAEADILTLIHDITGYRAAPRFDPGDLNSYPRPAFDLQHHFDYIPLITVRGCPYRCAYCASQYLNPSPMRRSAESVLAEITFWQRDHEIHDFVLYDDAFLVDAPAHALPVLEHIVRSHLDVRFHTPNALHIRAIGPEVAELMYKAGFETVRLGLETANFADGSRLDNKVTAVEFQRSVNCLLTAGFQRRQIGAYLLVGLPDQPPEEIRVSIEIVKAAGVTPILAYYSPIPHTPLWPQAVAASRYDLRRDPLFTNNAIMPCQKSPFSWAYLSELKEMTSA